MKCILQPMKFQTIVLTVFLVKHLGNPNQVKYPIHLKNILLYIDLEAIFKNPAFVNPQTWHSQRR